MRRVFDADPGRQPLLPILRRAGVHRNELADPDQRAVDVRESVGPVPSLIGPRPFSSGRDAHRSLPHHRSARPQSQVELSADEVAQIVSDPQFLKVVSELLPERLAEATSAFEYYYVAVDRPVSKASGAAGL